MLDLSKALYSNLELELFNTYLYKILTNKEINFKNEAPTRISIDLYPDMNTYNITTLRYYIPDRLDPFKKIKHEFELQVISSINIISELKIKFYNEIADRMVSLDLNNLTKSNIKKLLQIFYKWTKINFKQCKYITENSNNL